MYQVQISQSIYEQAASAALSEHVSLEEFVEAAVRMRLEDEWMESEVLTLSPEQLVKVQKAQDEIDAGKFLTLEQLDERLLAKKTQWAAEKKS